MKQPYLTIVISAYNEAANLGRGVLDEMMKFLKDQSFSWELIIVDDGSTDDTQSMLQAFAKKHPYVKIVMNKHQGKAIGVITGALKGTGKLILFTDMDQATPISELPKLSTKLNEGYDIVIGSRSGRKGAPLFRQILAYGMVVTRTLILRLPYRDTQCGFKLFTAEAANRIFTQMKQLRPEKVIEGPAVDPGFDVELLYLGRKFGYKIYEQPVTWQYQETRRVRFVYDAVSGIKGLLLVRWRALTGAYR